MSRHEIPAKNPSHTIIVGWDARLVSFYGEVIDKHDQKTIRCVGTRYREIPTVRVLHSNLGRFAKFNPALYAKLGADRTAPKHNGRAKA